MRYLFICCCIFLFINAYSQEDLIASLPPDSAVKVPVTGAFKSSMIINAHSVEFIGKGVLDFRILHRFGTLESGISEMFGLDEASMRIGLDYGISNGLTVGFGRTSSSKELDFFLKKKIIQQSKGTGSVPFSLALVSGAVIKTGSWPDPDGKYEFKHRLSYYHMLLIGSKINSRLSVQISPAFVHRNRVSIKEDNNNWAMGLGGRLKLTKRLALTADYFYVFNGLDKDRSFNPLAIGIDIETGGHVFQLHFSNSTGMNEKAFITGTTGRWNKGEARFGFNLSRVFQLGKAKKAKW